MCSGRVTRSRWHEVVQTCVRPRCLFRHGFQQHRGGHTVEHGFIDGLGNQIDANLIALSHVTTGVKIVKLMGRIFHALQIICHGLSGKLQRLLFLCAWIQRIRGMCQNGGKMMFRGIRQKSRYIIGIDVFGTSPGADCA